MSDKGLLLFVTSSFGPLLLGGVLKLVRSVCPFAGVEIGIEGSSKSEGSVGSKVVVVVVSKGVVVVACVELSCAP